MGKIELNSFQKSVLFNKLNQIHEIDFKEKCKRLVSKALEKEVVLTPLNIKSNSKNLKEVINEFNHSEFETKIEKASIRRWIELAGEDDLYEIFGVIWDEKFYNEEIKLIIRKLAGFLQ